MRKMRRSDREVTSPDTMWRMIDEALVVHLAMLDAEGDLYATCVHYGYAREDRRLYFHGAMKGRKAEALALCPDVAFQIVGKTEMVPHPERQGAHLGLYRSVMGKGRVRVVTDLDEKRTAIRLLHEHYGDAEEEREIADVKLEKVVNVFALEILEMSGKIKGYPNVDKPDAKWVLREW